MIKNALIVVLLCVLTACGGEKQIELNRHSIVLAFGDSLTQGVGANKAQSYPSVLANQLGLKVINSGVSGETSLQGLNRFESALTEHKPDLVILCYGGNDILQRKAKSSLKHNLSEMIEMAKAKGANVLLIGVPEPGLFMSSLPLYQELAEQYDLVADLETLPELLAKPNLKSDAVHLNATGYQMLANELSTKLAVN